MKTICIVWIILLSLFLAGCSEEPAPVPAEEVDQSDVVAPVEPEIVEPDTEIVDEVPDDIESDAENSVDVVDDEGTGATDDVDSELAAGEGDGDEEEVDENEGLSAENYRVISLKDLRAYPDELLIKVGTTVEWRNVNDKLLHIIGWRGQKQEGVKPEPMKTGESWSYTFNKTGDVLWFSTARPTVQGTIRVEE
ncbi:hypothetical protein HQ545_06725 [Candidatus Woesearchaeota archaeon]|nr:hypothetical protein [Candidatus Woesearchaeota archaeon]